MKKMTARDVKVYTMRDNEFIEIKDTFDSVLPREPMTFNCKFTSDDDPTALDNLQLLINKLRRLEYDQGLIDGYVDSCMLAESGYVFELLQQYVYRYYSFYNARKRTQYHLGYCRGFELANLYISAMSPS